MNFPNRLLFVHTQKNVSTHTKKTQDRGGGECVTLLHQTPMPRPRWLRTRPSFCFKNFTIRNFGCNRSCHNTEGLIQIYSVFFMFLICFFSLAFSSSLPVLMAPFSFSGLALLPSCFTDFHFAYNVDGVRMTMNDCENTTIVVEQIGGGSACYWYTMPQKCFCNSTAGSTNLPRNAWSATEISTSAVLKGATCYSGVWNDAILNHGATPTVGFCFDGRNNLVGAMLIYGRSVASFYTKAEPLPNFSSFPSYCSI